MAEGGLVEGIFGGEAEEREDDGGLAGADAVAVAVAMDAARHDPELAREAAEYLAKQGRLTELQLHHFDTERRLAIEAARRKRFADRIRNGLLAGAALVGLGVIGALAYETWSALHDQDLVVESFSVPPDLGAKGLTGPVVGAQVRDRLNALQDETQSLEDSERASNEPGNPIRMEIPETGVSLGEIGRWLRQRFGHETRVAGEVYHVTDASGAPALALTVRAGNEPGVQVVQPDAAFDQLVQAGAEKVYAATSPRRFAQWLIQHGRAADARELLQGLAARGPLAQRAGAEAFLSSAQLALSNEDALAHASEAARLEPSNPNSQSALLAAEARLGHTEAAYQAGLKLLKLPPQSGLSREGRWVMNNQHRHNVDTLIGDYGDAVRNAEEAAVAQAANPGEPSRQLALAMDHGFLHELGPLQRFVREGYTHVDVARPEPAYLRAKLLLDRLQHDWASVLADRDRLRAVDPKDLLARGDAELSQAEALVRLGRREEANAAIEATPLDCYPCLRARGRVAALEGDRAGADRWFAEALRQAPDLPFAETDWGDALLAEGRAPEAAAKYASAHAKGPRYADALKGWGDALARMGRRNEAVAKYDEALKLSPNWPELRQAREAAAKG
jgi:tetratricopeptide (TPR) repeat protein